MACNESVCSNRKCNFQEGNNMAIYICPKCGDKVLNFFDEEFDHESPRGDDETDFTLEDED